VSWFRPLSYPVSTIYIDADYIVMLRGGLTKCCGHILTSFEKLGEKCILLNSGDGFQGSEDKVDKRRLVESRHFRSSMGGMVKIGLEWASVRSKEQKRVLVYSKVNRI